MIYTLGHTESYERYFAEQGTPRKLGRTKDYEGGSVWETFEEAKADCIEEYSVYGVEAVWGVDTEPCLDPDGDWHDLLVTSLLVKIDNNLNVQGMVS